MKGEKVLVIIDLATYYCQGRRIKSKTFYEIIRVFLERWVGILGTPQRVLSDNSLEFQNNEKRKLADKFQIDMLSSSAENPWSNGLCEKMVGMIGECLWKVKGEEDVYRYMTIVLE